MNRTATSFQQRSLARPHVCQGRPARHIKRINTTRGERPPRCFSTRLWRESDAGDSYTHIARTFSCLCSGTSRHDGWIFRSRRDWKLQVRGSMQPGFEDHLCRSERDPTGSKGMNQIVRTLAARIIANKGTRTSRRSERGRLGGDEWQAAAEHKASWSCDQDSACGIRVYCKWITRAVWPSVLFVQ